MYDSFDDSAPSRRSRWSFASLRADADTRAPRPGIEARAPSRGRALGRAILSSRRLKRGLDVVGALGLLVFFAPFLAGICVALYVVDGRPLFFKQMRVGRGDRLFACYKMRSMVRNADEALRQLLEGDPELRRQWESSRKLRVDPRVHRLGALLRQTSFDELPQLLNVLRGEMSLVGPRPIVTDEIERFGDKYAVYAAARPGLTGLWQVSGRSDTTYEERVALDTHYLENRTLVLDLKILLKTVAVVWNGRGSY